jgi:hypothetical protein
MANGGTTPIYVQVGSATSRAVIISNRNIVLGPDEAALWVVLEDISRVIGFSWTSAALAVSSGGTVPGMLMAFSDTSLWRTAFSTLGPATLSSSAGDVTMECGLVDVFILISFIFCSVPTRVPQ